MLILFSFSFPMDNTLRYLKIERYEMFSHGLRASQERLRIWTQTPASSLNTVLLLLIVILDYQNSSFSNKCIHINRLS